MMRTWHFSTFYFFYYTTIGVMIPYWSLFLQHRGFSATEIGQLMAMFLVTKLFAPNVWASIADKITARNGSSFGLLRFASLITVCIYCLMYWADGFFATAMVMLGFCVFWNASLPQLEAATLNHLQDRRDQYGRIRLWGSVGFIVMVQGLGVVMDYTGPEAILPAGGIALLSVFLASFMLRDTGAKCDDPVVKENDISNDSFLKLINKNVIFLLALCVLMQVSHAPWHTFFSIYLEEYGYTKSTIGALWSIGVIFEIMVFIIGYRLLQRYRLAYLLSFTFLIAAIRWIMVSAFPESGWLILITQIMHSMTYGLYHSVMIKLIDRIFQGRYQIRGQALYSSLTFGLGGAIGSFFSGYIWTNIGHNQLFMSAGILMLGVFLISILFSQKVVRNLSQSTHLSYLK